MDGASRIKQMIYITLPAISGVIILLLILRIGKIMNAGFEQILVLQNAVTRESIDIFDTYVYRALMSAGGIGRSAAASVFQSIVGFALVMTTNLVVRKVSAENAIF